MRNDRTSMFVPGALAARALLLLGLAVPTAGCDSLLEVQPDPHTVPAEELDDPTALQARLIGAEANFFLAYDMAIVYGGLFTDELVDATGLDAIDERRVTADNGLIGAADENPEGIDGLWTPMQRAAFTSNALQETILSGSFEDQVPDPENSPELARMSLFAGYSKLILGELFCSTAFNGEGPEYTSQETYALAEQEFTTAIDAANADPDVRYAAYVGRARARLQLGDIEGAVQDATQVPPDFEYIANVYSSNSQLEENDIWTMLSGSQRFSIGPDFRVMTIDGTDLPDPRVQVYRDPDDPFAIDGSTPLYQSRKYDNPTAPVRLASGHEAQYIIAEIAAAEGDVQRAVQIINEVRARQGITVEFSSSPGEILRDILDERSRTLFLEGQRMGDLRRYLERYGINEFPPSDQPQLAGTCFPLPNAERFNNPGL